MSKDTSESILIPLCAVQATVCYGLHAISTGLLVCTKGQLISKGHFGILNSPKKRTKKFDFNTMIPQVDLFSFVFWKKLKTPKRHFEIN